MDRAIVWEQIRQAVLLLTQRTSRDERHVRKRQLLDYAGHRASEEIHDIEIALKVLQTHLPSLVRDRLDAMLDGSETEADVDDLVRELVADSIRDSLTEL